MPKYAAFLRGINVSNRRASKEELCSCFEALGYRDVTTFRASGNVIFAAGRESLATMTVRIEEGLARSLGYEVATFLRAPGEVRAIAEHEPFAPAQVAASTGKL